MEIRFAKACDVMGILALLRQVGRVHHEGRPDIFRAGAQKYGPSQILSMLDKPDTVIFVAVEEDKVLGYGFCFIKNYSLDPVMAERTELYIDDLCVDGAARGTGVGKALYRHVCRWAKEAGFDYITLHVWDFPGSAEGFYRSLGMKTRYFAMEQSLEDI